VEKHKNIKVLKEEPTSFKRTQETTSLIGSTKVVEGPYDGEIIINVGMLETIII